LIQDYVDHYNHQRPHQALGGLVPAEVFNGEKNCLNFGMNFYDRKELF
jgi:hypothetical protein